MPDLLATPGLIAAAATDVATIGTTIHEANASAAGATVGLIPAAADEVSAGIAGLFSQYAAEYHSLAGQAGTFANTFVQHLTGSANSFAGAEAASAASLGSIASSAADLPTLFSDGIMDVWNSVVKGVSTFWTGLTAVVYAGYLATWASLVFDYFVLAFAGLMIRYLVSTRFGIDLPIFTLPAL